MNRALKILVVEDEVLIAMMLEDMLADLGHVVVATAHSVEKATPVIMEGGFDVAILDVNLGSKSSAPLATALHERGIPFIVATGDDQTCFDTTYYGAKVVTKPFNEATLQVALQVTTAA